ncbi:PREDICTED: protein FLUORESCENT IN BLUE LIGHT, chloroplastic-like isoform X2 [Ipomoea nil]|uniref:protein FLUORESCENT IN BLUE LIGHT, chloroplastic-like isoform X2 n=1 Tax=Ipomoea nil TaxID=35883 RepID=UPI000900A4FE|nr:PREDICTED: protein FLUORESCENT IN BLUE LIGHT, chloroplastic-like isoform X2 [Ipomoea nil]
MRIMVVQQGLLPRSLCRHAASPSSFSIPKTHTAKPNLLTISATLASLSDRQLKNEQRMALERNSKKSTGWTIFPFMLRPATLIVANALMIVTPLEALAETCEVEKSGFSMPLLLFVSLIGATVGGLLARQRKGELKRLNDQLLQINAALKRQAKIESYAPSLSYAPAGARIPESEVIVDPRKEQLISCLRSGKSFLRNQGPKQAFSEFKKALDLAKDLKDSIEEKKAARGLGASLQRQGKYREAIKYHSMVLDISEREKEDSGSTEAYGAIADCYTELGDLERAAKYYDQYISRLQSD